jgi:hypothetical protein
MLVYGEKNIFSLVFLQETHYCFLEQKSNSVIKIESFKQ